MKFSDVTYLGPRLTDFSTLKRLPAPYAAMLIEENGLIAFRGGFHLRGICDSPPWHSLAAVWTGDYALHRLFPVIRETDVPFAQDCMGDQFILRDGIVHHLAAESGELSSDGTSLEQFIERMQAAPMEFLVLQPLLQFEIEGGSLQPGQSLGAYPPFVTLESGKRVSLSPIPMLERIAFLAEFARQIADVPDGGQIEIRITK